MDEIHPNEPAPRVRLVRQANCTPDNFIRAHLSVAWKLLLTLDKQNDNTYYFIIFIILLELKIHTTL